jgi:hypothetical protein
MKKITSLLFLLVFASLTSKAQSSLNKLLCDDASCTTTLSSAPTDGTTFYTIWVVSSGVTPINASITPTATASASFGTRSISSIGGTYYAIAWATTINVNQGLDTTFKIPTELKLYTSSPFISSLTDYYNIPTATALPVDFMNVNAKVANGSCLISWQTASEINNDQFIIERSVDGETWLEVGVVIGAGNSSSILSYQFIDSDADLSGKNFYRIKQIDFDQQYSYSDVVACAKVVSGSVVLYPNPALTSNVSISTLDFIESVEVRDISGHLLSIDFDSNTNTLNTESLTKGVYYVTVNNQILKLVK